MDYVISPTLLSKLDANLDLDRPIPPEMQIGWEKLFELDSGDAPNGHGSAEADLDYMLLQASKELEPEPEERTRAGASVSVQGACDDELDQLLLQASQQLEEGARAGIDIYGGRHCSSPYARGRDTGVLHKSLPGCTTPRSTRPL